MFKHDNLPKPKNIAEKKPKTRYRNIIMNFRVTEDEKRKIESRMALSGLSKQDFYIQSLTKQKVVCLGNVKSFDEMRVQLNRIEEHLRCIQVAEKLDEELLASLQMILELFDGLNTVDE